MRNFSTQPGDFRTITPHDDTGAVQGAPIYSDASTGTIFTPPSDDYRYARIVPISGGDIIITSAGNSAAPAACELAGTRLLSSAAEHIIPLLDLPKVRIAGAVAAITFQLSWLK